MTKLITDAWITDDVALITIRNIPADIGAIADIFESLGGKNINVDMISQSPPSHTHTDVSFTLGESDLNKSLEILAVFQKEHKELKIDVNTGNTKIALYSKAMKYQPGVAAGIFRALKNVDVEVRLITTSEYDVSVLIPSQDSDKVMHEMAKAFDVSFQS